MEALTITPCWTPDLEELGHTLLQGGNMASNIGRLPLGASSIRKSIDSEAGNDKERTVCVTGGFCFIGFAIVNCLIARGYTVRLALHSQEDIEKVREMDVSRELGSNQVRAVVADPTDVMSLCKAFEGCTGVFHTSAFIDSSGVSGYTKHMAKTEARAAERVVQACIQTETVRKCVFTSSLLACVWRRNSSLNSHLPAQVDENCWSDESLCSDKKLWFALGKTMAEKAAWKAARGKKLKLVTICPALITGPGFSRRNLTGSIAFLKGAQEMLMEGILATVDVEKVAKAHVSVFEAMAHTACGRYICFDHIIRRCEEIIELQCQLGVPNRIATPSVITNTGHPNHFMLSNKKLSRLLSSSRRCSSDTYSILY